MRRIIKEQLDELKFKRNKRMILSFLKYTVLPRYDWVCKFDVERMTSSNSDSIMVVIFLKPGHGHMMSQDNKFKLIDEIWEYIYEWLGIATYEKFEFPEHCDEGNITESRKDMVITKYFDELFNIA